jgi:hypothetical protein
MLVTDKIEKTAEVAIEVIDTVAEATEKVAGEVADAFPGNEDLKEAASKIKAVTDAIKEDADKAQALIHKVWLNYAIYCCLSTTVASDVGTAQWHSLASYRFLSLTILGSWR